MRVLLLSLEGDGLGIALKLIQQENEVGVWIKDPQVQRAFTGITHKFVTVTGRDADETVAQEHDFDSALDWNPDLGVCDVNNLTFFAEQLRDVGVPVLGGTKFQDALEQHRLDALQFASKHGVPIPMTYGFKENEVDKAVQFISNAEKSERWVVKSGRKDKASSFIAQHTEDIEPFMNQYPPKGPFILQQLVDGVCEINTECWFSQGKPIGLIIGGCEQKKFMPGDAAHPKGLGPNTGGMSNLGWAYQQCPDLFKALFTPRLLAVLKLLRYSGPLDMATIIDKQGKPWFIEFTPRFGYTAIYDMFEYVVTDWARFFLSLATGTQPEFATKPGYGFSCMTSISPYPQDNAKLLLKNEHVIISKALKGHFYPEDVMLKDDKLVTAGTSGALGVITGYGNTWQAARDAGMNRVRTFEFSDLQYRSDSGNQGEGLDKLRKLGYSLP